MTSLLDLLFGLAGTSARNIHDYLIVLFSTHTKHMLTLERGRRDNGSYRLALVAIVAARVVPTADRWLYVTPAVTPTAAP